jgi:membrane protease YdiL (CAAX protease family)
LGQAAASLGLPYVWHSWQMADALAIALLLLVAGRLWDRRDWTDYGFRLDGAWFADLAFGLVLGAALMLLIFALEWAAGSVRVVAVFQSGGDTSFWHALLWPLFTFLAIGFTEEAFVRGYILRNTAEGLRWGPISPPAALVLAWLSSSAFFGWLHWGNPNASLTSTIGIALGGLLLGLGYVLTGRLALSIGLHVTWNLFEGTVLGFPVSGIDLSAARVLVTEQSGPDLWTGGAFGPEAGLLGALVCLGGGALIVWWARRRGGRLGLASELACYRPPARRAPRAPRSCP